MALIKPSALVDAISGRIGGCVFALGKGSGTVRNHAAGAKRENLFTDAAGARRSWLFSAWRNMDPDTKAQWETFARSVPIANRFGLRRRLQPLQLFFWCRWPAAPWDPALTYWTSPPLARAVEFPDLLDFGYLDPNYEVSLFAPFGSDHTAARIQISRPCSMSRRPRPYWRAVFDAAFTEAAIVSAASVVPPLVGSPAPGEPITWRLSYTSAETLPTPWYQVTVPWLESTSFFPGQ